MRKKLNRKLKFALAGFGAFAIAGVSCVGLASLENQDAIGSYAMDVPTSGNPVQNGIFLFSYSAGVYKLSWSEDIVIHGYDSLTYGATFTDDYLYFTTTGWDGYICNADISLSLFSNDLILHSQSAPGVILNVNMGSIGDISNYAQISFQGSNYTTYNLRFDDFTHNEFYISSVDGTNLLLSPVLPPEPPTPVDYVHDIVDILVAGITNLGQGIGQGVSSFVQSLAFNTAGDGLSVYFVLVCVFGGIALAVALTSKIFMWLNGLGA